MLVKTTMAPTGKDILAAAKIPAAAETTPKIAENHKYPVMVLVTFRALTAGTITNAPINKVPTNLTPKDTIVPTNKR